MTNYRIEDVERVNGIISGEIERQVQEYIANALKDFPLDECEEELAKRCEELFEGYVPDDLVSMIQSELDAAARLYGIEV